VFTNGSKHEEDKILKLSCCKESILPTPPKLNMETQNDGFQKDSPFPADFQVKHVKLQGV